MRSLPPILTAKVKESLQTLGNVGDPKLKIAVSRAKTTVTDANYWTVEKIREKAGLGDISVAPRRFNKHYGGPDRLYEIHVDNGQVSTALREYPDKLKQGWQPQFDLGPSSANGGSVALAFDGEWELYRKVWRLRTHEVPWIFWVDDLGVLWGQLWNDEATKVELATGVLRVKAIRGWKELGQGQNDQGIVVAFIKTDGTVWYRSYCIQVDLTYTWESQRQITGFTGTAVSVGLFLTNDYRLGVTVQNNTGEIWWLITQRTWVGMAIDTSHVMGTFRDLTVEITPIQYYDTLDEEYLYAEIIDIDVQTCPFDFDISSVVITQAKRIHEHKIKLTFSHNLLNVDLSLNNFTVESKTVESVVYGSNNKEIILNIVESLPSVGTFVVNYTSGAIRVNVSASCRPLINNFTANAVGDPPVIQEYLKATVTNIICTPTLVQYRYANSGTDKITATVVNIVVSLTKVGTNPL